MSEHPMNGNSSYSSSLSQTGFSTRTLYVGNLDSSITESFIHSLFSPYGRISGLKLINDNLNDPYCFVEFEENLSAANAIMTMNKRSCLGREIKVNWATSPGYTGPKQDTSKHFHIFVGDLCSEIESQQLRDAFSPFGEISDCRVVRDPHSLKSKGYGFVSFLKKQDAESAIANMNGQWLGSRSIRTNWASRKPPTQSKICDQMQIGPSVSNNRQLNYEEVYSQSSISNCTVYCGGISTGLSEDVISKAFSPFGHIQEIRVFKDKGYAFIKFTSKEAATNAIVLMHNKEILGQTVKCSWGKETVDSGLAAQAQLVQAQGLAPAGPSLIYPYGQQVPYNPWYAAAPPPFSGQPYAVPPPAGVQYPYYSAAQSNQSNPGQFNPALTMPTSWQQNSGATSMHHVPNAHAPHLSHASMHHNSAIQQSAVMGAYPMQGYQAQ